MPKRKNAKPNEKTTARRVEPSSGNVFADLGVANPDLALAKAELVQRIREIVAARKLTQAHAARLLGIDQPKVSALMRGRVESYTLDRLFRFLNSLGQQIEISVSSSRKNTSSARPSIHVTFPTPTEVAAS